MQLRDQLPKHLVKLLKNKVGKKYLDMELTEKADNIIEGEWELSKEENDKAIQLMFGIQSKRMKECLANFNPSDKFIEAFNNSSEHKIDLKNPSIINLKNLTKNEFNLISVGETRADNIIKKDKNGKPILDENKKPIFVPKEVGAIIFSNNKSNFNSFVESYNLAFPDDKVVNPFTKSIFTEILSYIVDRNFDMDLFSKHNLQLYISGKPEDILNMSNSKFYDSCQNLYSGSYNDRLPPNIFDKNVKIAYLKFNTPYRDVEKNTVPFTIFSRCLIRNIRGKIYFDTVYPSQLNKFFHSTIEKYTGMMPEYKGKRYYYTEVGLGVPYMDTLHDPVALRFNPSALKDPYLMALATYLKETPEYIVPLIRKKDKKSKDEKGVGMYATEKGSFLILTDKKSIEYTKKYITKDMVYVQTVYGPYVDIEKFYGDNKDKLLKGYKGEIEFNAIAEWANSEPKRKEGDVRYAVKEENAKPRPRISKHNLYRAMRPFIDPKFFEERLTDKNIQSKRSRLADDDVEIDFGNKLFAYLTEKSVANHGFQNIANDYDEDGDEM